MSCSVKSWDRQIFDSPTRVERSDPELEDETKSHTDVPCSRPPFEVKASNHTSPRLSTRRANH